MPEMDMSKPALRFVEVCEGTLEALSANGWSPEVVAAVFTSQRSDVVDLKSQMLTKIDEISRGLLRDKIKLLEEKLTRLRSLL